jgi:hypothetical protein
MIRSQVARRALVARAIAFLVSSSGVVHAADSQQERARAHFDRGLSLVDAKRFEEAAAEFQTAHGLRPHPLVLYNLGMAQAAARRPARAIAALSEYLATTDAERNEPRVRELRARIAELETKVGHLELELEPAQAVVRIDGRLQPSPGVVTLDPGAHSLIVAEDGYLPQEQEVVIGEGERKTLRVRLLLKPPETTSIDAYPLAPQRPKPRMVSVLRVKLPSNAAQPVPARTASAPLETQLATKTPTWVLGTMAGTGVLLAAATTGLIIDNGERYSDWRKEEDAIAAERHGTPLDAPLAERQRLNQERADRIKLQDQLATGFGVASGLVLAATAVWWLLDPKVTPRSLGLRSREGQVLLVGTF